MFSDAVENSKNRKRPRPLFFAPFPRILTFHKLQPHFSWGITNYTPLRFAALLSYLVESGFEPLELPTAVKHPDRRGVAVTFDDGYRHLLDYLPPLIAKFGLRPTVFMPTAWLGKSNRWDYSHALQKTQHLSREEVARLSGMGVHFGSHGHSHTDLTRLDGIRLKDELVRSKEMLEDISGAAISTISYPFGRYNDRVIEAAEAAGYEYGFTMAFPTPDDRPLATGRHAVYGIDSRRAVLNKITPGRRRTVERTKCRLINACSAGTALINRNRDHS